MEENKEIGKINEIEKLIISSMSILLIASILVVIIYWIIEGKRTNDYSDNFIIYLGIIIFNLLSYIISTNLTRLIAIIAKNTCKNTK